MEGREPFQHRISRQRVGQSPEWTRMIFGERDISIELAWAGKRFAFGPRVVFRRIRVASRGDKCAKKLNVFLIYQPVLIHIDRGRNIIGIRKGILEKSIQYPHVVGSPSVIAVQIAEHDQFGVSLYSMGGNRELPVS